MIQIAPASPVASLLPFELISINDQYVVDVPGLKIVREIAGTSDGPREFVAGNDDLRILHVSLGPDPTLELGRERSLLFNELPGISVQFLMSPRSNCSSQSSNDFGLRSFTSARIALRYAGRRTWDGVR